MDNQKVKSEFVFIHGYTGGPTDFADLPEVLQKEFHADVFCPLLPGHGTNIKDLLGLTEEDLLRDVEPHIRHSLAEGRQVILVGLSFGAQAALYLASKYHVAGVVALGTTHRLKFPFNTPGVGLLRFFKRVWKKRFTHVELEHRERAVYYDSMPFDGLFICRRLSALVEKGAGRIRCPVLFLHSSHERLGDPNALAGLKRRIAGPVDIRFLRDNNHSMFFSTIKEEINREIVNFFRRFRLCVDTAAAPVQRSAQYHSARRSVAPRAASG